MISGGSYPLHGPQPLVERIGDGLDAGVRGWGDDEERGPDLGRELRNIAQVSDGLAPDLGVGVGEVAPFGEVGAHGADGEASVRGQLADPVCVVPLRLPLSLDGVVAEPGEPVDGQGNVFAPEADDVERVAKPLRQPLRPPAVSPLMKRRCRRRNRTTMGRIM